MNEGLGVFFPVKYKMLSVGASLGIVLASGLSFILPESIMMIICLCYIVMSGIGLYGVKNEFSNKD